MTGGTFSVPALIVNLGEIGDLTPPQQARPVSPVPLYYLCDLSRELCKLISSVFGSVQ